MGSGIKGSGNRPKTAKNLRGGSKKKRFKNEDSDKQKAYKARIAVRRDKERKRKARRAKG
jgi:hypothetical protein